MLKIFLILVVSISILFGTAAFAQQLSMGEKPQEDIIVTIDENGNAHVVHQVQMNRANATQVDLISGNLTNLFVTDQKGGSVQYSTISQFPTMAVLIFPADRDITLISYDLTHAVTLSNGIWGWHYFDPPDATFTDFHFPKGVNMIWSNNFNDPATARPVYLGGHGLRQVGNGFFLQYVINEPVTTQTVQWQDKTFYVGVQTLANVGPPTFDQSAMSYAFNVDQPNAFVTVIMPQGLLGGPYDATINNHKTLTNVIHKNDTYTWIGLRPTQSGIIQISGASVLSPTAPEVTSTPTPSPSTTISESNNTPLYIGIAIAVGAVGAGIAIMLRRKSKKVTKASR